LKLIFLIVSHAVSLLRLSRRESWWKDAEILMLRHQLTPLIGHCFVVRWDRDVLTPPGQVGGPAGSPGSQHSPLHQLPDRDERDAYGMSCQRRLQLAWQAVAQAGRCNIGVQDDPDHGMLARREA
jgi:hypothetical protein